MTREWAVLRTAPNGQAVIGVFDLDTGLPCASLERLAVMIPDGRYRLVLTESGRAKAGSLWSPFEDKKLPELLSVPGRSSIRVHALNHIMETQGCIGVGVEASPTELEHSRVALTRVVNELRAAEHADDDVWLTVKSA
jgi:hypothetical protein